MLFICILIVTSVYIAFFIKKEQPQTNLTATECIGTTGLLVPLPDLQELSQTTPTIVLAEATGDKRGNNFKVLESMKGTIKEGQSIHTCSGLDTADSQASRRVLLFLIGFDTEKNAWITRQASLGVAPSIFRDYFAISPTNKNVHSLEEIREVTHGAGSSKAIHFVEEQLWQQSANTQYQSSSKWISYTASNGTLIYPSNWGLQVCDKTLYDFVLPGTIPNNTGTKKEDRLIITGFLSNSYCVDGKVKIKSTPQKNCDPDRPFGDSEKDWTRLSNGAVLQFDDGYDAKDTHSIQIRAKPCSESSFSFYGPNSPGYPASMNKKAFMRSAQYKDILKFAESIKITAD